LRPEIGGTYRQCKWKGLCNGCSNNIYNVNVQTGRATLIGANGIPAIPFVLGSVNNGIANFFDQTLFGAGGKLYSTFDAFTFDFSASVITSTLVAPALYQNDPLTGLATLVGPTDLGIGGVAEVNGT
jgi:urea transporter